MPFDHIVDISFRPFDYMIGISVKPFDHMVGISFRPIDYTVKILLMFYDHVIGVWATLFHYMVSILVSSEFNANILAVLPQHMAIVFGVSLFFEHLLTSSIDMIFVARQLQENVMNNIKTYTRPSLI